MKGKIDLVHGWLKKAQSDIKAMNASIEAKKTVMQVWELVIAQFQCFFQIGSCLNNGVALNQST
jgi:hypothetical protein